MTNFVIIYWLCNVGIPNFMETCDMLLQSYKTRLRKDILIPIHKKNLCWMRFYKIIMNEHMKSRFVTFFLSVLILPSLHCYTSYNMIYMSDWHWSWRSIFSCELFAHMEMSHVILVTHIPNIIHQKLKRKETILGWNYSFPSMPSNMANSMRES